MSWKHAGTVENAVHRFRVKYLDPKAVDSNDLDLKKEQFTLEENPAEYARVEGDTLIFPMTDWNYRMIVLEAKNKTERIGK